MQAAPTPAGQASPVDGALPVSREHDAAARRTLDAVAKRKPRSQTSDAIRVLRRQPVALAGLAVVVGWLLLGALAPVLPIADPNHSDTANRLKPPSLEFPFGTDDLGRSMVSRVIWGARISVPAGIAVIVVSGTIGWLLGAVAGYFGGWIDSVIMRVSD